MAFRQHHRPQPSRQISFNPRSPSPGVDPSASVQRKRPLEESEEWVLFSPVAPSTIARTHTTSTDRTARTAGLSHLSDFGSLETAARSQDDDAMTYGTEGEELDSLDDGLHAFHEPSEFGVPTGHMQQSGETVLPTHDGLGAFQPDATMQEHLWQYERRIMRRPIARRRSSVQRRLDALESVEEVNQEQERRHRIEMWRLEQSKALLEEIERETRRRRRMSMVSAARSHSDVAPKAQQPSTLAPARSVSDGQSISSDESTENLTFWERLTRRVIRGLMGIDEDTLSVIFGESLPEEAVSPAKEATSTVMTASLLEATELSPAATESWEERLLEHVARELGILVSQLSEHPGAFSTYRRVQETPEYVGQTSLRKELSIVTDLPPSTITQSSPTTPFAPTFPAQQSSSNPYSEASLWGIEEEPEVDPLDSFRKPAQPVGNAAEDAAREQEYWERELDVKMVFNFLVQRFSSRRQTIPSQRARSASAPTRQRSGSASTGAGNEALSARRAAVIRQHHPLVGRADRLPTSSAQANARETRRKDSLYRQHIHHAAVVRNPGLRSSSSCASQSTKKSKHSTNSARNYWDLGGSVLAAEV